jgi:septum formation protein
VTSADPTRSTSLVLASASPRRVELLHAAGVHVDVRPADVDESRGEGEAPEAYVRRLAFAKADAIVRAGELRAILGADTIVVVDREVLGKPADAADARRMLLTLSGRRHVVLTGVSLIGPLEAGAEEKARPSLTRVSATTVEFADLTRDDLKWYLASGEPMGKAGAYAIQGLASRFVTRIDGSYSNVVGLPVSDVHEMCSALGILIS